MVDAGRGAQLRGGAALRGGKSSTRSKARLHQAGLSTAVGDEGGFAPAINSAREALDFIAKSVDAAGYNLGKDVGWRSTAQRANISRTAPIAWEGEGKNLVAEENAQFHAGLAADYPIASIEDGMGEDDMAGWGSADRPRRSKVQLVGDDLFVTNVDRLEKGIADGIANSILVKVNQIGTLTETIDAVRMAQTNGYTAVMSHRSGETEDSTIADLAVALSCGQIKTGSLARSDRTAKYNQLLRIEEELDEVARYAGRAAVKAYRPG